MSSQGTVRGPPDSVSIFVRLAAGHRIELLIAWVVISALSLAFWIVVWVAEHDAFESWPSMIGVLSVAAGMQLLMLYGASMLAPPRWRGKAAGGRLVAWYRASRLVAGLRVVLLLGSFALVAGVLGALDVVGLMKIAARVRETWLLPGLDEFFNALVFAASVAFVVGLALLARMGRTRSARVLLAVCGALAAYTLFVWIISTALDAFVFRSLENVFLAFLFVGWCAFVASCAALLWILFAQPHSGVAENERPRTQYKPVGGGAYLSSARGFSLVLLVAVFVSVDIGTDQTSRQKHLQNARQLFASHYVTDVGRRDEASVNAELPAVLGVPEIKSEPDRSILFGDPIVFVAVEQIDGGKWRAPDRSPDAAAGADALEATGKALSMIAAGIGVPVERRANFYDLFADVQRALIDEQKKVTVPLLGLPVAASYVAWALAGATAVLLLLIRSRVRRVFLDPDYAIEQPWLVMDADTGLERLAAVAWLLALLLAPWPIHAVLIITYSVQTFAEGVAAPSAVSVTLKIAAMVALFAPSAWVAAMAVADTCALRRRRRAYLSVAGDGGRHDYVGE